ncbi:MAG: hypothetical protein KIT74_11030 [Fimbriimonadales bacterium]|nr:hypothetical protein [Fimbriimonadales bacterium]
MNEIPRFVPSSEAGIEFQTKAHSVVAGYLLARVREISAGCVNCLAA